MNKQANSNPRKRLIDLPRRQVLLWIGRAVGALTGLAVLVPSALLVISPAWRQRRTPTWQPVGRLDDFPIDQIMAAQVSTPGMQNSRTLGRRGVYVWRPDAEQVVVFSRSCTDLGCPVTFDPGSECFFCPCHGGIFAKDGTRMAGPPPRPLHRFAVRVRHAMIEIDLRSVGPMV